MLKPLLIRRLFPLSVPAVLLLVLLSASAAYAVTLTLFSAVYIGSTVQVDWEVNTEADVTGFELSRKSATETSFTTITTTAANGQRRYQYVDANVYRLSNGGPTTTTPTAISGPYTYRLTVRGSTGDQSYLTVVAGTPSAVQRSWGTIKSMFR